MQEVEGSCATARLLSRFAAPKLAGQLHAALLLLLDSSQRDARTCLSVGDFGYESGQGLWIS